MISAVKIKLLAIFLNQVMRKTLLTSYFERHPEKISRALTHLLLESCAEAFMFFHRFSIIP